MGARKDFREKVAFALEQQRGKEFLGGCPYGRWGEAVTGGTEKKNGYGHARRTEQHRQETREKDGLIGGNSSL